MCRYEGAFFVAFLVGWMTAGCESSADGGALFDSDAVASAPDGAAGRSDAHAVAPPPSGGRDASGPSACVPALATCDAPGATCCAGTVCLDRDGTKRCVETCDTRFDCGSLCCEVDSTGRGLCVAADLCPPIPCSDVGGQCDGPGFSCCTGLACVSSTSPDYAGCRKRCTGPAECGNGCCVPYASGELGFCAEAAACACAKESEQCGGTKHCCDDLVCASGSAPDIFECKPACTANADCATKCCVAIPGTPDSACYPPSFCPP